MVISKTVQDVMKFVDYLEEKSFIPKNSAVGKKAAISKFSEGLSEAEQSVDYMSENFGTLAHRFKTKNTGLIQGSSLETYESRTRAALDDFKSWINDAAAWEKQHVNKKAVKGSVPTKVAGAKKKVVLKEKVAEVGDNDSAKVMEGTRRLTFPLSAETEVTVEFPVQGLTKSELARLGMFLAPYCKDFSIANRWPMIGDSEGDQN